jgi:hypothetical protein
MTTQNNLLKPAIKADLVELEHQVLGQLYIALAVQALVIVGLAIPLIVLLIDTAH